MRLLSIVVACSLVPSVAVCRPGDVIAVPDAATPVERFAAHELKDGLERCTGRPWWVSSERETTNAAVFVGATAAVRPIRGATPYELDEILMETRPDGAVVLDGHPDRGPIYAVHQYLEDCLGVRWWTATEASYPHWDDAWLPSSRVRFNPPFKYRESFYLSTFDAAFKVRGKGNFASFTRYVFPPIRQELPTAEMGGVHRLYFYKGRHSAYHSFFEVLPSRLIGEHPDWFSYSEKEGRRVPRQLCVTNEEMTRAYIAETLKLLRAAPETTFIQVSQNDAEGYCECADCKRVYEEEGAVSGAYLRFVNRVAAAIAAEFPRVMVDTFAYMFTRKAPKVTHPASNVVVRLCDIECGMNIPLADSPSSYAENRAFVKDLEDWSRIAKGRLYIWDYAADFRQYMLPRANLRALASNIRLFADAGAVGIFEQGDALCAAGSFAPLKQYLVSHLCWNPAIDDARLVADFIRGYYGPSAAEKIQACLDLLEREGANPKNPPLDCFQMHYRAWLTARGHLTALRLMNEAVAKAEADGPRYAARVRRERLSFEHAVILQFKALKDLAAVWKIDWPMRDDTKAAAVERWISEVRAFGVLAMQETTDAADLAAYFRKLRASCAADDVTTLRPGATEIVVAPDAAPTVRFAADELCGFLSKAFGRDVPISERPSPGFAHVFLGDSSWSRGAGIDVRPLARDAYVVLSDGKDVYVAGRDDPKADAREAIYSKKAGVWAQYHERATLFGVYGFLDRHAGVRMYFPGEQGTIVPKTDGVRVPVGREMVEPAFTQRNCCAFTDGAWYEGDDRANPLLPARKLNYARQRFQTMLVPCCHGEHNFRLLKRFGKTHPEYFVLKADGTRRTSPSEPFPGHLCHTSAVWDEMYRDVASYARGEPPDVRGMGIDPSGLSTNQSWSISAFRRPWVDLMPQDGFQPCRCEKCQAAYNPSERHYATDLIWGRTVELAGKALSDGLPIRLTQMSYPPYARVPDFSIPTNVDVMVAVGGPWSVHNPIAYADELERMRAWQRKLGRKVWLWTYPGKYMETQIPAVPDLAPRAWGRYLKAAAPYVFGAYMETQDERMFYHYLDYYVFGKLGWDTDVDVEALLSEHFRLMFGPAESPMARFVEELERKWVGEVTSVLVETDLGPTRSPPSEYELFTRVYSPSVLAGWRRLFAEARAAVAAGSVEARRIDLYEREYLLPLVRRAESYLESTSVSRELARRAEKGDGGNILLDGSFDQPQPAGGSKRHFGVYRDGVWQGGWIGSAESLPHLSLVREAPDGLASSLCLSVRGGPRTVTVSQALAPAGTHFKPGRRYRISLFVKLMGVKGAGTKSGFAVRSWAGVNTWHPERFLTGDMDWTHLEFFFTAAANCEKVPNALSVSLWEASGTVLVTGVRLEEMPE